MTPIRPQEIYLLERYSSLDYLGSLRETWGQMVDHLEGCLDRYMADLPPDYRNLPRPAQPDVVWGERVLPNFRDTFQGLCNGVIRLSHQDLGGLEFSHNVLNDFRGQVDFSSEWMSNTDEGIYADLLNHSVLIAGNIIATIVANWKPLNLTADYTESNFGPLAAPATWPTYQLVKNSTLNSGDKIIKPGIYLPNTPNSCAQFLYAGQGVAPEATAITSIQDLIIPGTSKKYGEKAIYGKYQCVWTLVERLSDSGVSSAPPSLIPQATYRIRAGDTCPQTGFYLTPARIDARRKFQQGEIMPDFQNSYGDVIWQWDINQN